MRTFVINLESSSERRIHIAAQLDALGIHYELFRAVAQADGLAHFEGYDEAKYLASTGRKASAGEAACFASHRRLWQLCVERGAPIVILEDDAALLPHFPAALALVEQVVLARGFVRLQEHGPARHVRRRVVERWGGYQLNYFESYPFGTMAYTIAPNVAARFVAASRVLTGPVDVFIRQFWVHGQALFGLEPCCVVNGPHALQSTMDVRTKEAMHARLRLARLVSKVDSAIRRVRFNRAFERSGGVVAAWDVAPAQPSAGASDVTDRRRRGHLL